MMPSRSGQFRQEWDGNDANGQRVSPGIYLYELLLDVEKSERKMGFVSVAY
jgi:flagellar hook assembly protein FlgD